MNKQEKCQLADQGIYIYICLVQPIAETDLLKYEMNYTHHTNIVDQVMVRDFSVA